MQYARHRPTIVQYQQFNGVDTWEPFADATPFNDVLYVNGQCIFNGDYVVKYPDGRIDILTHKQFSEVFISLPDYQPSVIQGEGDE